MEVGINGNQKGVLVERNLEPLAIVPETLGAIENAIPGMIKDVLAHTPAACTLYGLLLKSLKSAALERYLSIKRCGCSKDHECLCERKDGD